MNMEKADRLISNPTIRKQLESIGLSYEQYTSLPVEARTLLEQGALTPLIGLKHTLPNGKTLYIPAKLQLVNIGNGHESLRVFCVSREVVNDLNLAKTQLNSLKKGKSILRSIVVNGVAKDYILQLDSDTKHILRCPLNKMEEKLTQLESVENIQLGLEQKKAMLEGKALKLNVGGEDVVVGVDLRQNQGFKILNGNMDEWKRQRDMAYDEAHPEFIGLVQTEKNRWEYRQFLATQKEREREPTRVLERKSKRAV